MNESSAVIKLSKSEIEYVIIALVHAKKSSEHFSNFDYSKMFTKLTEDFVKIKKQLREKEKKYSEKEETYRTGEVLPCENCD